MALYVKDENGDDILDDNGDKIEYTIDYHSSSEDLTYNTTFSLNNDGHVENDKNIIAKAATNNNHVVVKSQVRDLVKPVITIWAEENGSINLDQLEWSFGNGTENSVNYGYCLPVKGKIFAGSLTASASGNAPGEIKVNLVVNANERSDYQITKPDNVFCNHITFQTPLSLDAGDRINFVSKTNNGSVTHALVSLLILIDVNVV